MTALLELLLRSTLLCMAMGLLTVVVARSHLVFRHNLLRLTMMLLLVLPATLLLPRFHLSIEPLLNSAAAATIDGMAPRTFLLCTWLAGVAAFGLVHLAGIMRLRTLLRDATPLASETSASRLLENGGKRSVVSQASATTECCPPSTEWAALLRGALDALGIEGAAHILLVPGITGPAALQWRKPLILLPPAALDWPADRVRVVLLHELAHLKRGDPRRNWLERLVCVVYWCNPFVWIINRMLHDSRELVCDSMVIDCGTAPARYAAHLLAIATEGPSPPLPAPALAMAPPRSRLGSRIRDLLAISGESRRQASASLLLMTALSVAGIAFVAISVDLAAPSIIDNADTLLRLTADPFPGN